MLKNESSILPRKTLRNLKTNFIGIYGSFTVSYETLNGIAINLMESCFCTKPLRISYETVNDPYIPMKSVFKFRKVFLGRIEDSFFKHFEMFSNPSCGFHKTLHFFSVSSSTNFSNNIMKSSKFIS